MLVKETFWPREPAGAQGRGLAMRAYPAEG